MLWDVLILTIAALINIALAAALIAKKRRLRCLQDSLSTPTPLEP